MLKKRLIPILLLKNGRCIKTKQFQFFKDTGNPATAAKIYDAQCVDELIFLDISASKEGRRAMLDVIARVGEECFMPLTIGGGITTIEDVRNCLLAGADKVVINTHAVVDPDFIKLASARFGSQCIVVSIDAKKVDGKQIVFTHGGTVNTGLDPVEWAKKVEILGAGEILVTSIDHDGMMDGYDLDLVRSVADAVKIPVLAGGGAGTLKDLVAGVVQGHASAVCASSIFHFTDQSPIKARFFMKEAGLNVRHGVA